MGNMEMQGVKGMQRRSIEGSARKNREVQNVQGMQGRVKGVGDTRRYRVCWKYIELQGV